MNDRERKGEGGREKKRGRERGRGKMPETQERYRRGDQKHERDRGDET